MPKITLKGTFISVTPARKVGETGKEIFIQDLIFKVPGYVDSFGDKKGQDEYWQIQIIGEDNVRKHNLSIDLETQKATLNVWINSKYLPGTQENKKPDMYIINAVLADYQLYNK